MNLANIKNEAVRYKLIINIPFPPEFTPRKTRGGNDMTFAISLLLLFNYFTSQSKFISGKHYV